MRQKVSAQTRMVLDVLAERKCHLTADEILDRLDGVGVATVYRALDRLVQQGCVRRLSLGQKSAVYEYVRQPHMHFVCSRCGAVYDVPADLSGVAREAAGVCGHRVEACEVTARGVCQACLPLEAGKSEAFESAGEEKTAVQPAGHPAE